MPSLADVVKGDSMALTALVRDCMRAKAQLRGDRVANVSDVFEFLTDLGYNASELTVQWATEVVFQQPEWEFRGLWTALRRPSVPRKGKPQLVKLYHLVRQPKRCRRLDKMKSCGRSFTSTPEAVLA